ncbi:MAG: HAMP domain-containing protein [Rhodospirillaceae bacterium]|nr:HAMP domain-containing protein [Rhodospirillaceae bacterium]
MHQKLRALFPTIPDDGLRVGYSTTADNVPPHFILISVRLADGSWINASTALLQIPGGTFTGVLGSTILMALAIVPLGIWLMRATTRPLRTFAQAAERLGRDVDAAPVPESGPSDVRRTVRAFNDMQSRIRQLLGERTQMLAALSHDLRTPLTRLRLRAELIEDDEQQERMLTDLREMEAMVNSALAYLRDDAAGEDMRRIDVASLLDTIASEASDRGCRVSVEKHAACVTIGRPLALKRAFSNLVDNAIKYGDRAQIALRIEDGAAVITIDDSGPGIPAGKEEVVFKPFIRLEPSRSRDTGGVGLGLSLARTVFRSHGGEVRLENLGGGGLRALVTLPAS